MQDVELLGAVYDRDGIRLKILKLLLNYSEMTVTDMAGMLEVHPSTVSHHLAPLKSARLVRYRKSNVSHFRKYRLANSMKVFKFIEGLQGLEDS